MATSALGWRSALYPEDWEPGWSDGDGRFLHDFSHAGYHEGSEPIPDEPPGPLFDVTDAAYLADPTGGVDSTVAIQRAIDDAGAAGGGVVLLPAGTYRVSPPGGAAAALTMAHSGVVLRGEGPDETFLLNAETSMRGKRIILVRPYADQHSSWYWSPSDDRMLAADLPARSLEVAVESVDGYAVGDWIVIRSDPTADLIADYGMTGTWVPEELGGIIHHRRVVSIDPVARILGIDVPTRTTHHVRDAARVNHLEAPLEEVGIEHLAIGNLENETPGTGDEDYAREGTGAWEMHDSFAIYLNNVVHGWVRDVSSFRTADNGRDVHLLSNGIRTDACRFVTIADTHLQKPQYRGEGGNGNLFVFAGQECLATRCTAEGGRHDFTFGLMQTSGNVLHRSTSRDARLPSDFHMHLSAANLVDNLSLDGDFVEARFRDCCGHGHSTTESVIWNTEGVAYPDDQFFERFIVDSGQFGEGYVIGTRGAASEVRTPGGDGTAPIDFTEGSGEGEDLDPASLYEDQLARRLGPPDLPGDPDAGAASDAGAATDAGAGRDASALPGFDSGPAPDAAASSDGAPDPADGGAGAPGFSGGCGCSAPGGRSAAAGALGLAAVAQLATRRRRRRPKAPRACRY
ncbi:MAG: hypothetical protein HYY06_27640 [Deltaproteobacteria bacterium]|nr:hypothetical protein [Deltaproteobacteria bacterium]